MATSSMHQHLREYVEEGIQQKIRLDKLITEYKDQEKKTRERIVDGTQLQAKFQGEGIDPVKIGHVKERTDRDIKILTLVQDSLKDSQESVSGMAVRLNTHLEELSTIELQTGGFVTHAIGVGANASLDKANMSVNLKSPGHAEIPVAVRLNKWKDSSQLTIRRSRGEA